MTEFSPKARVQLAQLSERAHSDKAAYIAACEAHYEGRVAAAAKQIAQSGCPIVMLTGPSASSKTTTSKKLVAELRRLGRKSDIISLDDFFRDISDYPLLPDGSPDLENLWALDVELVNNCLSALVNKGCTMLPRFDFISQTRQLNVKQCLCDDETTLVVEGIHALNPALTEKVAGDKIFKVYAGLRTEYYEGNRRVIATRDVRIVRRMIRDVRERGHEAQFTLAQWGELQRGEELWIKPFKKDARMLIDTSFEYEPCLLGALLRDIAADETAGGNMRETLLALCERFSGLPDILPADIPQSSTVREFIGGLQLQG